MKRLLIVLMTLLAGVSSAAAQQNAAQQNNPNQAQLRLVIVDQTGAGIPGATVLVTPQSGNAITFQLSCFGCANSKCWAGKRGRVFTNTKAEHRRLTTL